MGHRGGGEGLSKSLNRMGACARPPGPSGAHPGNPGLGLPTGPSVLPGPRNRFFPRALQPGRGQHWPAPPQGSRLLCGSGLAGLEGAPAVGHAWEGRSGHAQEAV